MSEIEKIIPASTDGDLLPVVDEHDREIGAMPRREVHLKRLRHRAVHVALFDAQGRLWLQQRSRAKDTYGGWWDLSCTGHVDPGEDYESAARRELREELGIDAEPNFVVKLEATERRGWEFHALYWLRWNGAIDGYDRREIEAMRLFAIAEIESAASGAAAEGAGRWPVAPGVLDGLPYLLEASKA